MATRLGAALVLSLIGFGVGFAAPASACVPVSVAPNFPTGFSKADEAAFWVAYNQAWSDPAAIAARNYGRQEQMWLKASSVVLVRITAFNRPDPRLSQRERRQLLNEDPTLYGVTLEPVRWLKGQGGPTPIRVRPRGWGDCSVAAGWDARSAKVGDIFVAYFGADPLSDSTLLDGIPAGEIVEPIVRALLSVQQ